MTGKQIFGTRYLEKGPLRWCVQRTIPQLLFSRSVSESGNVPNRREKPCFFMEGAGDDIAIVVAVYVLYELGTGTTHVLGGPAPALQVGQAGSTLTRRRYLCLLVPSYALYSDWKVQDESLTVPDECIMLKRVLPHQIHMPGMSVAK